MRSISHLGQFWGGHSTHSREGCTTREGGEIRVVLAPAIRLEQVLQVNASQVCFPWRRNDPAGICLQLSLKFKWSQAWSMQSQIRSAVRWYWWICIIWPLSQFAPGQTQIAPEAFRSKQVAVSKCRVGLLSLEEKRPGYRSYSSQACRHIITNLWLSPSPPGKLGSPCHWLFCKSV